MIFRADFKQYLLYKSTGEFLYILGGDKLDKLYYELRQNRLLFKKLNPLYLPNGRCSFSKDNFEIK